MTTAQEYLDKRWTAFDPALLGAVSSWFSMRQSSTSPCRASARALDFSEQKPCLGSSMPTWIAFGGFLLLGGPRG